MLWLGEKRGYLTDWVTQQWVCLTGKQIDLEQDSWLKGLVGKTSTIGTNYFTDVAQEAVYEVRRGDIGAGLLQDFDAVLWNDESSEGIQPAVRQFYEHTAAFDMDVWSQWSGIFRPFGWLLAAIFSRRLQQLNVPLSGLDTSRGVTSDIIQLVDSDGNIRYTAWLRQLVGTGNVLYAGSYSVCRVPACPGACVKVVFPLPNGNAIVIMKPTVHKDGSFSVTSSGEQFGDAGFYFTVHRSTGEVYARYVPAMRESIHVYEADSGDIRADHILTFWRITFLKLHYRLRLKVNHDLAFS